MQSQHKWQRHLQPHSRHRLGGCLGQTYVSSVPGQVWDQFSVSEEILVSEIFKITSLY